MVVEAPNTKLSDRRSGRSTCPWVEKWRWSVAGDLTAEPLRFSAWLGLIGVFYLVSLLICDKNKNAIKDASAALDVQDDRS